MKDLKIDVDSINCFEALEDGTMTIYIEDHKACIELRVSNSDVKRMMVSGIDALAKEPSRR